MDIVAAMFTWFDEVYLIEGNHDRRANKATKGEIGLKFLMDLAFKYADVKPCVTRLNPPVAGHGSAGPGCCTHPQRGYSRIPGRLPRSYWEVMTLPPQLLRKYGPIKPHVIGTHTHHLAEVLSPEWPVPADRDSAAARRRLPGQGAHRLHPGLVHLPAME